MSRNNRMILGLFGLLYEHMGLRDLNSFLSYLQRVGSDDTSLLISNAEVLVRTFRDSGNVVWAMNTPEYEFEILKAAVEVKISDRDTQAINLQKKISAFTYIRDFLEIHNQTFPYMDTYFELIENPNPEQKDYTSAAASIDDAGKLSKSLPAILLPSAFIGATVMYAIHKTTN